MKIVKTKLNLYEDIFGGNLVYTDIEWRVIREYKTAH